MPNVFTRIIVIVSMFIVIHEFTVYLFLPTFDLRSDL